MMIKSMVACSALLQDSSGEEGLSARVVVACINGVAVSSCSSKINFASQNLTHPLLPVFDTAKGFESKWFLTRAVVWLRWSEPQH